MNPLKLRYVRGQWGYSGINKTGWIRLHAAIRAITGKIRAMILILRSTV